MKGEVRKLEVRLTGLAEDERVVGTLAAAEGRIYFEYAAAFLADPIWLSPFKLPPQPGLFEHHDRSFGPLPGLFDDSLPDGWGLLLMDRFFRQQGKNPAQVGPLERLAFLGAHTMGALTYHPPSDKAAAPPATLELGTMARAAAEVLRGSAAELLPQLLKAGGSPGGARPKILVGVHGDDLISGEGELPPDFAAWIIKFPADPQDRDAGRIEEAYARMARAAGIAMPPTRLFETREGDAFFGVQRFDRAAGGRRFHVHTFGNLIHANFRLPSCDYQQLLEVTRLLTRQSRDVAEQYRRMVFNVLSHNRDDHAKNFAFRLNERHEWELSPAYDLVFAEGPGGEHTTSIAGEGKNPSRQNLLAVAAGAGLAKAEAEATIDEVATAVAAFNQLAKELGMRPSRRQAIGKAIKL